MTQLCKQDQFYLEELFFYTGFIVDIETRSTHIRIYKTWKWVFAAVFLLGKVFLGFAIFLFGEPPRATADAGT